MNNNNFVLITGASSGIGSACVASFLANGFNIIAGTRTQQNADNLKQMGDNVYPVLLDITDQESINNAYDFIKDNFDVKNFSLINNAGVAVSCPVEFVNMERLQYQFDVNVFGQVRMIQKFLPLLRETKGKIVNVSSILGTLSLPYTSPYCASKSAFDSLTDGLRMELDKWGIGVILIKPGIVKTPIWQKSSIQAKNDFSYLRQGAACFYGEEFEILASLSSKFGNYGYTADNISTTILKAIKSKRNKPVYFVGNDAKALNIMRKFPAGIVDKIILNSIKFGVKFFKSRC